MAHEELWQDERIERLVEAGFAKVSRSPSDHETAAAYRYAIKLALTSKADKLANAQAEIEALRERVAVLEARLEVVPGVSLESSDGIACRDETIRLQDQRISRFLTEIEALRAELAKRNNELHVALATIEHLGENAATAAREYADNMAALRTKAERLREALEAVEYYTATHGTQKYALDGINVIREETRTALERKP